VNHSFTNKSIWGFIGCLGIRINDRLTANARTMVRGANQEIEFSKHDELKNTKKCWELSLWGFLFLVGKLFRCIADGLCIEIIAVSGVNRIGQVRRFGSNRKMYIKITMII